MVTLKNINKSFGSVNVLQNLTLEITPGKIVAVLGPNGSGKTTMIKSILGMVLPDSGEIEVLGQKVKSEGTYRNKVNYLPQIARFPDNLKVKELIHMIQDIRNVKGNPEELITQLGIEKYLDKRLGNLSGGTRQKVNLVLTFMFDGELYVLDEPTAGLDPVSLIHLKEIIQVEKKKGKTLLITSHILPLVEEMADEIVFLLEGCIHFHGTMQQLREKTGESQLERAIAHLILNNND